MHSWSALCWCTALDMQIWALRCASFSPAAGTRVPQAAPSTALSNTFCSLTFWLTKEMSLPTDPNYIPEQQENSVHLSSWRQPTQFKPSPAPLLIQDITSHGSLWLWQPHASPQAKGHEIVPTGERHHSWWGNHFLQETHSIPYRQILSCTCFPARGGCAHGQSQMLPGAASELYLVLAQGIH